MENVESSNTNGATPEMGTTGDKHCQARISLGRVWGQGLTAVAGPGLGKAFCFSERLDHLGPALLGLTFWKRGPEKKMGCGPRNLLRSGHEEFVQICKFLCE